MRATSSQFFDFVIPAANDYAKAESELSHAHAVRESDPEAYRRAERQAVRRASELAIALFSLTDRASEELGVEKKEVRRQIDDGGVPAGSTKREGAESRIRSVGDAYKHFLVSKDRGHSINSADDILGLAAGYGVDGYGVGKMSTPEVLIKTSDGTVRKFTGDAHFVLRAWKAFRGGSVCLNRLDGLISGSSAGFYAAARSG